MNSISLIESMSAQNVILKRQSTGSYVNGIFVPVPLGDLTIRAGVQPTSGEDLISLPEGQRERESYKIYSVTEMQTAKENTQKKADVLEFYGKLFEVQQVQRHFGLGLDHYKAIVTRLNEI